MKILFQAGLMFIIAGFHAVAEESAAGKASPPARSSPPTDRDGKALTPEQAALIRYQPKYRKAVAGPGSRVVAATRGPGVVPVKLVALAPQAGGVTITGKPRLWWWQSADTAAGEMEFVLSRLDDVPREVLSFKLGPMMRGYNAVDLNHPAVNPTGLVMEPGIEYQWVVGCFSKLQKSSVFVRMARVDDPYLVGLLADAGDPTVTLEKLAESGNWYELFDAAALRCRSAREGNEYPAIRARLLEQIGLGAEINPR